MRKSVLVLFVTTCCLVLVAGNAGAITVPFNDNSIYWPDWGNGSGDDSNDTIGIPNFTGGTAEINESGYITDLTFNQSTESSSYWGVLSPGDLFIDANNDQYWDYVVKLFDDSVPRPGNTDPIAGDYGLYSINQDIIGGSGYILSGSDKTGYWSNWYIRNNHPVALNVSGSPIDNVHFSGWDNNTPSTEYSFGFDPGLIGLGSSFAIGWTPNCANDVVYETLENPNPVPEPATMLLLGSGLIGLGWFGRRRTKKGSRV